MYDYSIQVVQSSMESLNRLLRTLLRDHVFPSSGNTYLPSAMVDGLHVSTGTTTSEMQ